MASSAWFIIGIVLLASELIVPTGFFLFLLGVAACLVGVLTLIGPSIGWEFQSLVFAVLAIAFTIAFAGKLRRKFLSKSKPGSSDTTGQMVLVDKAVQPGEVGSGELWGSPWHIKNVDTVILDAKSEVTVVHAEGVTLHVRRKSNE